MQAKGRRDVGRAWTVALGIIVVTAACSVAGFYVGRNVLGEQYLKRSASKLKPRPTAYVAPQSQAVDAPVVEQPTDEVLDEPEAPRRPHRAMTAPQRPAGAAPGAAKGVKLQLGCFLDGEKAKMLLQDLRNRGYSATVTQEKQGGSTLHRVTMGAGTAERAQALAGDLQREGYEVIVVDGK